jgi:hypothetical protein
VRRVELEADQQAEQRRRAVVCEEADVAARDREDGSQRRARRVALRRPVARGIVAGRHDVAGRPGPGDGIQRDAARAADEGRAHAARLDGQHGAVDGPHRHGHLVGGPGVRVDQDQAGRLVGVGGAAARLVAHDAAPGAGEGSA